MKYVETHEDLNPLLWKNGSLREEVSEKLSEIADAFVNFINIKNLKVIDYVITGSNAGYSYVQDSDIDLHIIVKGKPTEQERELYDAKKGLWNKLHVITIRKMPVEVYVQGEEEEHVSNGIYSIKQDGWVQVPSRSEPDINHASIQHKVRHYTNLIKEALESEDITLSKEIKDKIKRMRKKGLSDKGEWSIENITFKTLRYKGLIGDLLEHIEKLQDKELSLARIKT